MDEAGRPSALFRASLVAAVLSLSGLWAVHVTLWPTLPTTIPLHFDAAGVPDRTGPATPGGWYALPTVASGMTLLLLGIAASLGWLVRRHPGLVNVPNKAAFLLRPPAEREWIVRPVGYILVAEAILLHALFAILAIATARIANGQWTTLPVGLTVGFLIPLIGVPLFGVVVVFVRSNAEQRPTT